MNRIAFRPVKINDFDFMLKLVIELKADGYRCVFYKNNKSQDYSSQEE